MASQFTWSLALTKTENLWLADSAQKIFESEVMMPLIHLLASGDKKAGDVIGTMATHGICANFFQ